MLTTFPCPNANCMRTGTKSSDAETTPSRSPIRGFTFLPLLRLLAQNCFVRYRACGGVGGVVGDASVPPPFHSRRWRRKWISSGAILQPCHPSLAASHTPCLSVNFSISDNPLPAAYHTSTHIMAPLGEHRDGDRRLKGASPAAARISRAAAFLYQSSRSKMASRLRHSCHQATTPSTTLSIRTSPRSNFQALYNCHEHRSKSSTTT
mmetsp:Transcript_9571/g.20491  ORF Transcript_9571/g.20491 Transcript_9571/m.20491 type:complete len:207 (-) Transcript_9571:278-898(-)